jgi:cell division protein FtsN
MSKDYKGGERRRTGRGKGSSLLTGILIGLVLGLAVALGVAWYINKMPSPFTARTAPPSKPDAAKAPPTQTSRLEDKSAKSEDAKPRFEFYKILPGTEEPAPEKAPKESRKGSTASATDAFFLQAGAFQNAPDADNLKARLALLGVDASIETTTLPDKGVWHRVRMGPYTSVEELNRVRDTLKQNGVQTTLVKARETER